MALVKMEVRESKKSTVIIWSPPCHPEEYCIIILCPAADIDMFISKSVDLRSDTKVITPSELKGRSSTFCCVWNKTYISLFYLAVWLWQMWEVSESGSKSELDRGQCLQQKITSGSLCLSWPSSSWCSRTISSVMQLWLTSLSLSLPHPLL